MDLSSLYNPDAEKAPQWYDFNLAQMQGMDERTIETHLFSMSHSMGRQGGQRLRLILTERDSPAEGRDPCSPETYNVKGLRRALTLCEEVVIRRRDLDPAQEFVVKSRDGETGWRPIPRGAPVQERPDNRTGRFSGTQTAPSNPPRGGRRVMDL